MTDLRQVKEIAKATIKKIDSADKNWKWRVDVLKNEIRVWWSYLQYCDTETSHFTINMCDDFLMARNEHDDVIAGKIVGAEFYCDGDLNTCVEKLLINISSIASSTY